MKTYFLLFLMSMAGIFPVMAQEDQSYESFRKRIQNDFHDFRKKVLDDYDRYLNGIWREYEAFRGVERTPIPKPPKAPIAHDRPKQPTLQTPISPDTIPENPHTPPSPFTDPVLPASSYSNFDFYCLPVKVPQTGIETNGELLASQNFAALWKTYTEYGVASKLLPYLKQCSISHNFNDWFIFQLVQSYADHIFPSAQSYMRISLMHYLLTHWGYDVRIGLSDKQHPILLVAIEQMVYARSFTELNGQRYYIFHDSQEETSHTRNFSFTTCDLPENLTGGRTLNLIISKNLNIPYSPHSYSFSHNGLQIQGEINANLMPFLYHYPQMPMSCYAQSHADSHVYEDVVIQFKSQLANKPQKEAVDSLLQFVQSAFAYATDDEQHGFEKPYFFEEMLYYPQCDCEDRSIFYSYLLWHVLGVENQLIGYPGHEAVSVHLNAPINGDGYTYQGTTFYISDPTYIGAVTGMCMPKFRNEHPKIDFFYRNNLGTNSVK